MNLDDSVLATFLIESAELLADMEAHLLGLVRADDPAESINAIFRAAHTIKGSAGLFAFDHVIQFTHAVESVLDALRDERIVVTDPLVTLLLECTDHIAALLKLVESGVLEPTVELTEREAPLMTALCQHLPELESRRADAPEEPELVFFDETDTPPEPSAPAPAATHIPEPTPARDTRSPATRTIRVDADRLDHLINLVGELIISAAGADLIARGAGIVALREATSNMSGLVEELRNSALQLRMVKIGGTFNRFQRVVRDVSRDLGKDIELVVSGEDTELDKTVVERIGDPLMHLIRNAMDHGIESAEKRVARGKSPKGTLYLNAHHEAGSIVIEVRDDGGGLDRDKILAKAESRGIIQPGTSLSDSDVYGLVFEPGFSTADEVTNLSGRGVGMDVVKRNISALRGTVTIDSEPGVGTRVTVRLPLTLAMIQGFLVTIDESVFVVPLDAIEECRAYDDEAAHGYATLRGEVLPLVHLRDVFATPGAVPPRQNIVVIRSGELRAGLVVDGLLGEFQTVIKPLGRMFSELDIIGGSTILGNGDVALILDVPALLTQATTRCSEPATSRPVMQLEQTVRG